MECRDERRVASPKLLLFDLDGTLVDTEPIHYRAFTKACRILRLPACSYEDYLKLVHVDDGLSIAKFAGNNINGLNLLRKKYFMKYLKKSDCPIIHETMDVLVSSVERDVVAIVTNSTREYIELIKKKVPALSKVTRWIVREDCNERKPSPWPYLRAIELWGESSDEVHGYEDSIKGLRSLKSAIDIAKDRGWIKEGYIRHVCVREYPLVWQF